jgi:hypothetical protein
MASTPTFTPNPYANFDPSQWSNPYSQFYGQALPWPSSYAGTPNNALGQPIQPPQGMTLNNTPAQPQAPAAPSDNNNAQWQAIQQANLNGQGGITSQMAAAGIGSMAQANAIRAAMNSGQQAQPQAAAPAPPNNWQNTLSMLANPGHVATPGATVPQAQSPTGVQPGVLQSFLANWQPAQSGPGSGFTQNFNALLRGLPAKGS